MPTELFVLNSNFTLGEIDERLHARVDFAGYYKGAKRIRNMLILPQGGVQVRFGTQYIDDVPQTISDYTEVKIKLFEYEDETTYLVVFTENNVDIYHDDALVANAASTYAAADIPYLKFAQTDDKLYVVHPDYQPRQLYRTGSVHTGWAFTTVNFRFYPTYDFDQNYDAINFTPSGTSGTITITASSAVFKSSHVGGIFVGNEGTARITTYTDTTHVNAYTVSDFANTNPISGDLCYLAEPAFSSTLGWPRSITFYQNRLVFGGAKSLLSGVFMSKVGPSNFFDFDDSQAEDDSAIVVFISTGKTNVIDNVLGAQTLWVFTTGGISTTGGLTNDAVTPSTIVFNLQGTDGIYREADPIFFDGQIIYVDRGGKIIRSLTYSVSSSSYVPKDISVLSQHLISTPYSIAEFKHPTSDNGHYLFMVNDDGTLAVFQSLLTQDTAGWSLSSTDGYFRHITATHNEVYFITERTIDGSTVFYIEKLDFDLRTDCAFVDNAITPATATISGLDHLEGETVRVIGDGFVLQDRTVASGEITLEKTVNTVEVGMNYTPSLIPMPISVNLPNTGVDRYLNKRIQTVYVDYYQSLGIYVDEYKIKDLDFDDEVFDTAPTPVTGFSRVNVMKGWDPEVEVEITQEDPLPMTIRGIGMTIQFETLMG